MGIINNLFSSFGKQKNRTKENENSFEKETNESLLKALINKETITREKAMTIPAVASAVDKISNTIAILPVYLYKKSTLEDNKRQITKIDDNRVKLLNEDTGDTLDAFQFKKALIQDYLLDKGGFAYVKKEKNEVKGLYYVEASKISYIKNVDPIFKDARYMINGKYYEMHQIIRLLRETKDGIAGKGIVEELSKALETAFSNIVFELNLAKKGGIKKGFLTSSNKLTEEALKSLKEAWKDLNSPDKENMMVLNNGLQFQDAGTTGTELQLNERKQGLNEEINNIFHINKDFDITIKEAIIPIVKALETALNRSLLLEDEKADYYFAFDLREITKGSIKERYQAYKVAIDNGWQTKNEVRLLEDMEQIDGLDTISFGLANVIYDIKTKAYYVPNTGSTFSSLDDAIKNSSKKGGEENENTNKE